MLIVSGKLTLWLSLRLDIEAMSKTKRLSWSMSSGGRLVKWVPLAERRAEQAEQHHASGPSIVSHATKPRSACSTLAAAATSSCTSLKASVRVLSKPQSRQRRVSLTCPQKSLASDGSPNLASASKSTRQSSCASCCRNESAWLQPNEAVSARVVSACLSSE